MRFHSNLSKTFFFIALSVLITLSSCEQRVKKGKGDIVAYVNKEPVLAAELKRNIDLKAQTDPLFKLTEETEKDQLNMIIDKKLIIQEAIEKGLVRDDRFVHTIKSFWEQTLIRDFIRFKRKEFQNKLVASEEEIKDYYSHLGKRVTFKVLKSHDKANVKAVFAALSKGQDLNAPAWEIIGPVDYTEIDSAVLKDAFEWPVGAYRIVEQAPLYYLVMVAQKEVVSVKPFNELKADLISEVISQKEKRLFDQWLDGKRAQSKITILE